jgi:hypothetical protein
MDITERRTAAAEETADAATMRAKAYADYVKNRGTGGTGSYKEKFEWWRKLTPEDRKAYGEMQRGTRTPTDNQDQEERLVATIQEMSLNVSGEAMSEEEARLVARAKPGLSSTVTAFERRGPKGEILTRDNPMYRKTTPAMVNKRQFALPGLVKSILKRYGLNAEDIYAIDPGYSTPEDVMGGFGGGEVDSAMANTPAEGPDSSVSAGPTSREEVMQTEDPQVLEDWLDLELTDEQYEWVSERIETLLRESGALQ